MKLRSLVLSGLIALSGIFFLGIFWKHPVRTEVYNKQSWYYLNRGIPVTFAGVAKADTWVNFPIVRVPFLAINVNGVWFNKIIDLRVFGILFLGFAAFAYPLVNKISSKYYWFCLVGAILLWGFLYWFWFPRI